MKTVFQTSLLSSLISSGSALGPSFAGSQLALGSASVFLNSSRNIAAISALQMNLGRCPAAVFARAEASEVAVFASPAILPDPAGVSLERPDISAMVAKQAATGKAASKSTPSGEAAAAAPAEIAEKSEGMPAYLIASAPLELRASEAKSDDEPDGLRAMQDPVEDGADGPVRHAEREGGFTGAAEIGFQFSVDFTIAGGTTEMSSSQGRANRADAEDGVHAESWQAFAARGRSVELALAQEVAEGQRQGVAQAAAMLSPGAEASIRFVMGSASEADPVADAFASGLARSVDLVRSAGQGARPRPVSDVVFKELAGLGSFRGEIRIASSGDLAGTEEGAVLTREIGGRRIEAFFARQDGELVFAGWRDSSEGAFVAQPDVARDDAGRVDARFDGIRVMGLGQPGGESSFGKEPLEIDDPEVVERLTGLVIAQLAAGPASLERGDMLRQFNAFVRARLSNGSSAPHTPEQWDAYLKEALVSAVRLSTPFDDRGARSIEQIESDAARMLGIELVRVSEWEEHFNAEFISEQLFETADSLDLQFDGSSPKATLAAEFVGAIESMAKRAMGAAPDPAVSFVDEASVQWSIARAAMLAGITEKADRAAGLMRELRLSGKRGMASRALAVVFKASAANEAGAREDGIVERWSEAELSAIIKRLMNDETWDVASHRSFRMHLTPAENAYANRLVETANLHNVVDVVRSFDLSTERDIQEVWDAIDSSGHGEAIIDSVVQKMTYAVRLSPGIIDASMSEEIN